MRLDKIKLAGFKSFVDPTTILFPSSLAAIVGPNGCGKSNVIDAVRWVMGESSAKNLRGGCATDVIFNGSNTRKPVSQAFVELIFDNSKGTLVGEYASYAELSIKRTVDRDGQSQYYLNNTKCRRRDITEIFLGTGMGPRSYSIIEQGMISYLVEAKPDELRVYLEEAAGISRYKERRRETENRMSHTRENLERLSDLRDELEKQLKHLERQAQAAGKFAEYKDREKVLQAQVYALRFVSLRKKVQEYDVIISDLTVKLESENSRNQNILTGTEREQQSKEEAADKLNLVQKKFYAKSAEIARMEQSIKYHKDKHRQLTLDLSDAKSALEECIEQRAADQQQLNGLTAKFTELEPEYLLLNGKTAAVLAELADSEQKLESWQQEMNLTNSSFAHQNKTKELAKAQITNFERSIEDLTVRITRLLTEKQNFNNQEIIAEIERYKEQVSVKMQELTLIESKIQEDKSSLSAKKQIVEVTNTKLSAIADTLRKVEMKIATLQALQQASLLSQKEDVVKWLKQHSLMDKKRLAEVLNVAPNYATAVETVLGNLLEAICVDKLDLQLDAMAQLNSGNVILLSTTTPSLEQGDGAAHLTHLSSAGSDLKAGFFSRILKGNNTELVPLISKINNAPIELYGFLDKIFVVDNLKQAREVLKDLPNFSSVVTLDGSWLGHGWIRVVKGSKDHKGGILAREQELKQLEQELVVLLDDKNILVEELRSVKALVIDLDKIVEELHASRQKLQHSALDVKTKLAANEGKVKHLVAREEQVERELFELSAKKDKIQISIANEQNILSHSTEALLTIEVEREELLRDKEQVSARVFAARVAAAEAKNKEHALELQLNSIRTSSSSLALAIERFTKQIASWQERQVGLFSSIEAELSPLANEQARLEIALEEHLVDEQELSEARTDVAAIEERMRALDKERNEVAVRTEKVRNALEQAKMNWQAETIRMQGIEQQFAELAVVIEEVLQALPEGAIEKELEKELEQVQQKIKGLGAINLAAIEEYSSQSERKKYLDEQNNDLVEALELLESAIRKIDKETRERFKETYDKVNAKFGELYPLLFGGGTAYLELIGDDLLDTGVAIMARPPGKKNSLITQLSGGEKALTAVALVFAIFHLNPAPFCMLDEVDAPLDDTNVGRFCNLVKEMSKEVQFIYISHNKLAMEMAHQLHGVTMKEPGVSRIVSVNIEEAVEMVD